MSYRSSLPITLMSIVGLIAAGLMTTCGGIKASADPGGDRIGCGTFCQDAGGYGAVANSDKPSVTIVSHGTVTPDRDGYAPATVTCDLTVQCSGALLLCLQTQDPALINLGMAGECGRSDLLVSAGTTRTIGVPLPAAALTSLRSHGPTSSTLNAVIAHPPDGFTNLNSAILTVAAPG
jgi:hypothetical protein